MDGKGREGEDVIDVLLPVLGRPHRVAPLLENLALSTSVPLRIRFLCSAGDRQEIAAVKSEVSKRPDVDFMLLDHPPAQGQYAKKINLGYRESEHPWLFLGADDIHFHQGWAEIALEAAGERFHVISFNDKMNYFVRQGLLATHSLIRRSYADDPGASLEGPGSIYYEGYNHNFVDCELSVLARDRGVFRFVRAATIEHLHPLAKRAPMDDTYMVGLADFDVDRATFVERFGDTHPRDQMVRRFKTAAINATRRQRRR
jgi:hypothetical protein